MTAVAAVQERLIRKHFCSVYWLMVGADAVGEKIKQLQAVLYRQITGKSMKGKTKRKSIQDTQRRQVIVVSAPTTGEDSGSGRYTFPVMAELSKLMAQGKVILGYR